MPKVIRRIILVDDSDDDEFFIRRIAAKLDLASRIVRLPGGQEAIAHFEGTPATSNLESDFDRDLVFLDIQMPSVGGFDVLSWLRANCKVTPLPFIVILSSSDHPADIQRAKLLGADGFVVKPICAADFLRLESELGIHWNRPIGQNPGCVPACP